ncbi:hypothetical protein SAMN05216604_102276 [Pseudomonas agarici]|nr:hypothetical protein SAMN05216604_102276 [Pseudomonas agarici]
MIFSFKLLWLEGRWGLRFFLLLFCGLCSKLLLRCCFYLLGLDLFSDECGCRGPWGWSFTRRKPLIGDRLWGVDWDTPSRSHIALPR